MSLGCFETLLLVGGGIYGLALAVNWIKSSLTARWNRLRFERHQAQVLTLDQWRALRHPDGTGRRTRERGVRSASRSRARCRSCSTDSSAGWACDLTDVVDALTGAPPDMHRSIFQCERCAAVYGPESMRVLREERSNQCLCGHRDGFTPAGRRSPGPARRWADASVAGPRPEPGTASHPPIAPVDVTLHNYRGHVGQIIVYEGEVRHVVTSLGRDGTALMLEDGEWEHALKVIAEKRRTRAVGGVRFLRGLAGRTVRLIGHLHYDGPCSFWIPLTHRNMLEVVR
jgi:hypothetical protein